VSWNPTEKLFHDHLPSIFQGALVRWFTLARQAVGTGSERSAGSGNRQRAQAAEDEEMAKRSEENTKQTLLHNGEEGICLRASRRRSV
jgi:hypothetical protein